MVAQEQASPAVHKDYRDVIEIEPGTWSVPSASGAVPHRITRRPDGSYACHTCTASLHGRRCWACDAVSQFERRKVYRASFSAHATAFLLALDAEYARSLAGHYGDPLRAVEVEEREILTLVLSERSDIAA